MLTGENPENECPGYSLGNVPRLCRYAGNLDDELTTFLPAGKA